MSFGNSGFGSAGGFGTSNAGGFGSSNAGGFGTNQNQQKGSPMSLQQGQNLNKLGAGGGSWGTWGTSGSSWGTSGSSWGNWGNKNMFNQNKPLINENMTLAQIEEESKKTEDLKQALKIIVDLHELVNKHNDKMKPLEGTDSFEKKLIELEDDTKRAIVHTIMSLAREIDHGNSYISEYRDKLENFTRELESVKSSNRPLPSPFLKEYIDSLERKEDNINKAIQSFTDYLNSSSIQQSPQNLIHVLQQQYEAIVRCSARISHIREKSNEIEKKMKNLLSDKSHIEQPPATGDESSIAKSSFSKTVMEEYEKFLNNKKNNLEKRDNDREKFTKEKPNSTYSWGKGTSWGSGSSWGSGTNWGASSFSTNNKSSTGTSTSGTSGFGTGGFGTGSSGFGTNTTKPA